MAETKYCQQWTTDRGTFALLVSQKTGIHPRIMLAWMAVESGGDPIAPRGAKHNYLMIKEPGFNGARTSEGFAIYRTALGAARAAARRIQKEPGIRKALGKGPDVVMKAIARTWDDGPGVTTGPVPTGYYNRLKERFNCIDKEDVKVGGFLGVNVFESGPGDGAGAIRAVGNVAGNLLPDIPGWVSGLLAGLWPVLLKTAVAGTGLALIGYGVSNLAKSGSAGEHVTKAAPVAAAVAQKGSG